MSKQKKFKVVIEYALIIDKEEGNVKMEINMPALKDEPEKYVFILMAALELYNRAIFSQKHIYRNVRDILKDWFNDACRGAYMKYTGEEPPKIIDVEKDAN